MSFFSPRCDVDGRQKNARKGYRQALNIWTLSASKLAFLRINTHGGVEKVCWKSHDAYLPKSLFHRMQAKLCSANKAPEALAGCGAWESTLKIRINLITNLLLFVFLIPVVHHAVSDEASCWWYGWNIFLPFFQEWISPYNYNCFRVILDTIFWSAMRDFEELMSGSRFY